MTNLNRLSAIEAARKLATREITAQALLADCVERIREREPAVRAWTHLDVEGAMAHARRLDAQAVSGLLHGLPIAVKDLFDTFDMPTSYGSPIYANHRPAGDAASVATRVEETSGGSLRRVRGSAGILAMLIVTRGPCGASGRFWRLSCVCSPRDHFARPTGT